MVSPNLARFLSDLTLGFSDGLTVPFALTAGLSSLGRSETVIYAGLAELCAGCISMGIGGYLAARDASCGTNSAVRRSSESGEEAGILLERPSEESLEEDDEEKDRTFDENTELGRYLQPLGLPESDIAAIFEAIETQPGGLPRVAKRIASIQTSNEVEVGNNSSEIGFLALSVPVSSGLSIALGYVCGGLLPLLPYFIASSVGQGLRWSIVVCLIALLAFGAGKSWALGTRDTCWKWCLWEGVQMALLGSCAAGAAVLCVNLVNKQAS